MSKTTKALLFGVAAWSFAPGTEARPTRRGPPVVLQGRPRDSGQFQPIQNKCMRNDKGEVILAISSRAPGEWGGCCLEQMDPVILRRGARPQVDVTLEHEDSVDIKFESGQFGKPTATGWVHRGPMKGGPATFSDPLVDDFQQIVTKDLKAQRMCIAFVGTRGPATNQLVIRSVKIEH